VSSRTELSAEDRDETWAALVAAAEGIAAEATLGDLDVVPVRRRQRGVEQDGLFTGNDWVDVFEPVRERKGRHGTWTQLRSVDQAKDSIFQFLRERPDQTD